MTMVIVTMDMTCVPVEMDIIVMEMVFAVEMSVFFSQDPIKQPMIQTRDKQQKKEAVDMFKLLLQYMGDKKCRVKDPNVMALDLATRAWEKKGLRDEIYIQLCRQTTSNDKPGGRGEWVGVNY